MMKKILLFVLPVLMILALFLKINGVDKIELTPQYYAFMRRVIMTASNFKIEIPNIPLIPTLSTYSGLWVILDFLINFVNQIVSILNVLVMIINIVLSIVIWLISLIVEVVKSVRELLINNPYATISIIR